MNSLIEPMNRLSEVWWLQTAAASWQEALVAGLILAFVWVLKPSSAPFRYGLLVLALLKFAFPPLLPAPTGLFSRLAIRPISRDSAFSYSDVVGAGGVVARPDAAKPVLPVSGSPLKDHPASGAIGSAPQTSRLPLERVRQPEQPRLAWTSELMLLHAAGCIVALAWIVSQVLQLRWQRQCARVVEAGPVSECFKELSSKLGLRRSPQLLSSTEAKRPVVFGVLTPTVLVPESLIQNLTVAQMRPILAHELAHCRRGDLWMNWVQLLLLAAWWFHPLLWILNRSMRRTREDCCDDLLLVRGLASGEQYCDTLIRAAREVTRRAPMVAGPGLAMPIHPLGRRVARIMDQTIRRRARLSPISLATLAILGSLLLPGLGGREAKPALPEAALGRPALDRIQNPMADDSVPSPPESLDEIFTKLRWVDEHNIDFERMRDLSRTMGNAGVSFLLRKLEVPPGQIDNGLAVEERRKAVMALGFIAPDDPKAVSVLQEELKDNADREFSARLNRDVHSIRVSALAADALGRMEGKAISAFPGLLEAAKLGNARALVALARIDPQSPAVLELLMAAVHDISKGHGRPLEGNYQLIALDALEIIAPQKPAALVPIEAALSDPNPDLRQRAAEILIRLSDSMPAVGQMVAQKLASGAPVEQAHLAAAAAWAGGRSDAIYSALVAAIRSGDAGMQGPALKVLPLFGARAKELAPLVLKTAATENESVRAKALETLGIIGGDQIEVVDLVIANLRSRNLELQAEAFRALSRLGKSASRAEPILLEIIQAKDRFTSRAAVEALGKIGARPEKAIPVLKAALDDPTPYVRDAAIASLASFGPASLEFLPLMIQMLDGTNAMAATSALDKMGPLSEPAVAALAKALTNSDERVRGNAANALGSIGARAQSAVPALRAAMRDERTRNNAASALGRIGPAAAPAIPDLVSALKDKDGHVRLAAGVALWRIDGRTDVVRLFVARLQSEDQLALIERPYATSSKVMDLYWLGKIGPAARNAIPVVEKLLKDPHDVVRTAAAEALAKIQAFESSPGESHTGKGGG